MKRHEKSFWVGLVAEVGSGASAVDVAARYRVRVSTLRWWCSHLRRESAASGLRLVPVVTQSALPSRHIEIAVGSAALRVEEGTDVAYVAALARALKDAC
jgi:transposase-like protein